MTDVLSIISNSENFEKASNYNFKLKAGHCGQIIGLSASGKTKILLSITMRRKIEEYKIILFGKNLSNISNSEVQTLRRRISFVNYDCNPLPHLTVFDNLALALRLQELDEIKVEQYCNQLLSWLKLSSVANESIDILSQGQLKLLVLSQAIIRQPEFLIIDNLHNGLDELDRQRIGFLLEKISQKGMTILVSSHEEIIQLSGPKMFLKSNASEE